MNHIQCLLYETKLLNADNLLKHLNTLKSYHDCINRFPNAKFHISDTCFKAIISVSLPSSQHTYVEPYNGNANDSNDPDHKQRGTGGLMGLPLHETDQGLERKGWATSSWSSSHYEWRMDVGDATMASQESNGSSQTAAQSMKTGGVVPPSPEQVGLVYQPTEPVMMTVMPLLPRSSHQRNDDMDWEAGMAVFEAILL